MFKSSGRHLSHLPCHQRLASLQWSLSLPRPVESPFLLLFCSSQFFSILLSSPLWRWALFSSTPHFQSATKMVGTSCDFTCHPLTMLFPPTPLPFPETPQDPTRNPSSHIPGCLTPCSHCVLLESCIWPRAALLVPMPVGQCVRRELAIAGRVTPDSP